MALDIDASASGTNDGVSATLTYSHTCSGSNRAILVGVAIFFDQEVSSVTYAGVGMTLVGSSINVTSGGATYLYKLSNPASGANDVVVTLPAGARINAGSVSFNGAHQTTASLTGTVATANSNSSTITVNVDSAIGEIVIDAVAFETFVAATAGVGQTERWSQVVNFPSSKGSTEAGAASVTMSWGLDGAAEWATVAVSVKPLSSFPQTLTPSAIASAEAFGSDQLNFGLLMNAIASAEAFGSDQLNLALLMNAIASAEAFGTPTIGLYVLPPGVASEEEFGTAFIFFPIDAIAIDSGEAFGFGFVHFDIPLDPDLIALLVPDLDMDVTSQVFSIPNVEEVDFTVNLAPDMELDVAPQEWDFSVTVN